jgi:hypothetical protein
MMREMMRWDPFRMIGLALQVERDVWMPHFEVRENSDEIRVIADVPGVEREDLEVSVNGNRLVLSGQRQSQGARQRRPRSHHERAARRRADDRHPAGGERAGAQDPDQRRRPEVVTATACGRWRNTTFEPRE